MTRTLLFVDDEPNLLAGLQLSLRESPYEILVANSADEAMLVLQRHHVDMVIADEHMPRVGGSRLLAKVRDLYPGTLRVMFSGRPDVGSALHAINEAGVHRYVTKPCRPKALLEHIAQTFAESVGQNELLSRERR